ncbi:MAG: AAA family ATPase [Opitutus sp.]
MVSPLTTTTGWPPVSSDSARLERLRALPTELAAEIKGQDQALRRICSVLVRGELGFAHPRRPRGSFLLVGPTGVGKTETVNVFTALLFNGAAPIRFDMSEYQLQSSVEKLIGSDRDDRGLLGRALHGVTGGTLLLDEIEKAHSLVLDLFLQLLEDGRITLATGETVDVRQSYVCFTSNIGSEETMRMENAPFASIERTVLMRVRDRLRPELVGRINEIVVYGRLNYFTQRAICEAMVSAELGRLAALGHKLEICSEAVEFLLRQGYHRMLGARPLRGAVERFLQDALAQRLLGGQTATGKLVPDPSATQLVFAPNEEAG